MIILFDKMSKTTWRKHSSASRSKSFIYNIVRIRKYQQHLRKVSKVNSAEKLLLSFWIMCGFINAQVAFNAAVRWANPNCCLYCFNYDNASHCIRSSYIYICVAVPWELFTGQHLMSSDTQPRFSFVMMCYPVDPRRILKLFIFRRGNFSSHEETLNPAVYMQKILNT